MIASENMNYKILINLSFSDVLIPVLRIFVYKWIPLE